MTSTGFYLRITLMYQMHLREHSYHCMSNRDHFSGRIRLLWLICATGFKSQEAGGGGEMKRELHLEEETYDQTPQRGAAASLDVNNNRSRAMYKITLAHIQIYWIFLPRLTGSSVKINPNPYLRKIQ